jgi:hypothetical protein
MSAWVLTMRDQSIYLDSKVTLDELIAFERKSWPPEERASELKLRRRLKEFQEGFRVARTQSGQVVAQTFWKPVDLPQQVRSFEQMEALPIQKESKNLWGVNIDCTEPGKGVGKAMIIHYIQKMKGLGYQKMAAGIRLTHLRRFVEAGSVNTPEDYLFGKDDNGQALEPLLNLYARAAITTGVKLNIGPVLPRYWSIDRDSMGYGALITLHLG